MNDGPHKYIINDTDYDNVITEEFKRTYIKDGILYVKTSTRKFTGDDYDDTNTVQVIWKFEKEENALERAMGVDRTARIVKP